MNKAPTNNRKTVKANRQNKNSRYSELQKWYDTQLALLEIQYFSKTGHFAQSKVARNISRKKQNLAARTTALLSQPGLEKSWFVRESSKKQVAKKQKEFVEEAKRELMGVSAEDKVAFYNKKKQLNLMFEEMKNQIESQSK